MKLIRLDVKALDEIASSTNLEDRPREMAKQVLVDGRTAAAVAADFGVTPQRVSLAVGVIRKAHAEGFMRREGWVCVETDLPSALTQPIQSFVQALAATKSVKLQRAALDQVIRALSRAQESLH